jgi:hypothetical protein
MNSFEGHGFTGGGESMIHADFGKGPTSEAAEKVSFTQILGKGPTSVGPLIVEMCPRFSA